MSERSPEVSGLRNAAGYALVAGGPGAILPFLALWLANRHLAISQVGLFAALPFLGRLVFSPVLIAGLRRFGHLRIAAASLCGTAAFLCLALLAVQWGPFQIFAWLLVSICIGACSPLLDVTTLRDATRRNFSFSLTRSAGAISYVLGGIALGELIKLQDENMVPIWGAVTAALAALGLLLLFKARQRAVRAPRARARLLGGGLSGLAVLALAANGMVEASHGFQSIATIFWRQQGYDSFLCGLLWQTGTAADIAFLWMLSRWRPAPSLLLVLGAGAAMIRWAGSALGPALPGLFALQALHVLSVTACTMATLELIENLHESGDSLPWQIMNWGIAAGLCNGLSRIGSGVLYEWAGLGGYWWMCALAAVGLGLAVLLHAKLRARAADQRKQLCCRTEEAPPVAAAYDETSAQTI